MKLYTAAFLLIIMSVSVIHAGKNVTTLRNRKEATSEAKPGWQLHNELQDNRPLTQAVVCCIGLSIIGGAAIQSAHLAIDAAIKKMA